MRSRGEIPTRPDAVELERLERLARVAGWRSEEVTAPRVSPVTPRRITWPAAAIIQTAAAAGGAAAAHLTAHPDTWPALVPTLGALALAIVVAWRRGRR